MILLLCSENKSNREKCLIEIGEKFSELERAKWQAVAHELQGEDLFQYLRAYSPGMLQFDIVPCVCRILAEYSRGFKS